MVPKLSLFHFLPNRIQNCLISPKTQQAPKNKRLPKQPFASLCHTRLIAVVFGLVGTFGSNTDVFGLLPSEGLEFYTELGKVEASYFLVQVLGQGVYLVLIVIRIIPMLDFCLRQLIGCSHLPFGGLPIMFVGDFTNLVLFASSFFQKT